jgi:hypothetical protein
VETTFDKTTSILNTVKKTCGLADDYTVFDQDILVYINGVIIDLTQNGVGPSEGYLVTDSSQTWGDFLGDFSQVGAVATYISQKVRMIFDPPSTSFVGEAIQKRLDEMIWRLSLESSSS